MPACPVIQSFAESIGASVPENTEAPRSTQKDRAVYISDWAVRGWSADLARQAGLEDLACDLSCLGDFYDLDLKKLALLQASLEYKRTPKYYLASHALELAAKAVNLARMPMTKKDWTDIGTLCGQVYDMHRKSGLESHSSIEVILDNLLGQPYIRELQQL